ncbi:MAG: septal ring lytic transglycosylase RlpA family protein [Spirochaetaceae bacterium]|jgi:rare lipoprotein A|nr:septal ring lytic transglycosylase RlpA family protein [Spirochaetaceae bacterium]
MKRFLIIFLCLTALVTSQIAGQNQYGPFRQEGIASWYGDAVVGRQTASGEAYDPAQLTAAHPTLPFGTMVSVTNEVNRNQVIVRINDRGPFVSGSVITLSKRAAELLAMTRTGSAPVMIQSMNAVSYTMDAPGTVAAAPSVAPSYSNSGLGTPLNAPVSTPQAQSLTQAQPAPASIPAPTGFGQPVSQTPYQQQAPYPQTSYPPAGMPQSPQQPVYPQQPAYQQPSQQLVPQQPAQTSLSPQVPSPAGTPVTSSQVIPLTINVIPRNQAETLPPLPQANVPTSPAILVGANPQPGMGKSYRIQVGAYLVPQHAVDAIDRLKAQGLDPAYERSGDYYRVVLSGISAENINSIAEKLGQAGFAEALVREEN